MPRKKQFAVEDVRQKAMATFWSQGYNATSLQDLVDSMGINRASLYDTFQDKYSLFLDSLCAYRLVYIKSYLAEQMKKYTPRQAIINYFLDMILKADDRNGCLMVNTALELSPHDDKVAKIVEQSFNHIERNFFRKLIERGQATGEIAKSVIPITTARALLSLLIGLCVLSRGKSSKPMMGAIVVQVKAFYPLGIMHPCPVRPPSSTMVAKSMPTGPMQDDHRSLIPHDATVKLLPSAFLLKAKNLPQFA